MIDRVILTDKPDDELATVQWAKEEKARMEKSDAITRELKEKLTPIFSANFQKAKLSKENG